MNKTQALELLGGTVTAASEAIGISPAAVSQWPEELSDSIRDRVQAALWRKAAETQARTATETIAKAA
jgi:DNA-binding transcriptional regulator YdaS (Cro superfamily)